jgi:WD40 repeat protein
MIAYFLNHRFGSRTTWLIPLAAAVLAAGCGKESLDSSRAIWRARFNRGEAFDKIACRTLALSPDGDVLFAGGSSHWTRGYHLRLWDAAMEQELVSQSYLGTSAPVLAPDTNVFFTGGMSGDVSRRDAKSGSILNQIRGHNDTVRVLAISPDGRLLATAADDGTASLRDATTLLELHDVSAENGKILSLAFTSDSQRLLAGTCDGIVSIWSLTGPPRVADRIRAELPVSSMVLSPGDSTLVTLGSKDCGPAVAKFWAIASSQLRKTVDDVSSVAFSTDGGAVAVASAHNATVTLCDSETLAERARIVGNMATHYTLGFEPAIAFSPDGTTLAIGVEEVRLVNVADGREQGVLTDLGKWIKVLQFSPAGRVLVAANDSGDVIFWDTDSRDKMAERLKVAPGIESLMFANDGDRLLIGSAARDSENYGIVQLVDASTGRVRRTLNGHTRPVCSLSVSPDGRQLATSSWDRTVRLWDISAGRELSVLPEQPATVFAVAFSPAGSLLATAGRQVSIWDVTHDAFLRELPGTTGRLYCVAFSSDGTLLAAAGQEGVIHVWQVPDGTPRWSSRPFGWPVRSLAFSPDGKRLVAGGGEFERGIAIVCEAETGRERISLAGHAGPVTAVQISDDGEAIYTAGADQSFRIWNATTADLLVEERDLGLPVASLAIQRGGRTVVVAGLNGFRWFKR